MEGECHDNASWHDANLLSEDKGRNALRTACVEIWIGENACLPVLCLEL